MDDDNPPTDRPPRPHYLKRSLSIGGMIATYAELLAAGWTPGHIRQALKTGALRRLTRGVYADEPLPDLATRVAGQLRVSGGAASHHTAAALRGFGEPGPSLHLTVPYDSPVRPGPGLEIHRTTRPIPWEELDGIAVTTAYRTVLDLARWCPFGDGVALADAALAQGSCDRTELLAREPLLRSLPGARRARRVLAACRDGAQSPMETRTRLLLTGHGLPEPTLQHPVPTAVALFHVDLAWPGRRVCVEYDGRDAHSLPAAFARDRQRWRALSGAGWDVHPVTAVDLRRPATLVREIAAALA